MTSGHVGQDLGRWGHGASNSITCQDGHGELSSGLTDRAARQAARQHAAEHGHIVEIERAIFQTVYPSKLA